VLDDIIWADWSPDGADLAVARLLELGEAPPDLLKFDIRFVRGINDAPPSRRRLLK